VSAARVLYELPVAVFTFDRRGGLMYSNAAAQHAFGALAGAQVEAITAGEEDSDKLLNASARLERNQVVVLVLKFRVANNGVLPVHVACSVVDAEHHICCCVLLEPIKTQPFTGAGKQATPARAGDAGGETVLVVEDEPTVRSLVQRVLERNGYHVLCAADAASAMQVIAAQNGAIDLLLTDLVMPGIGGRDLAAQAKAQVRGLRVVYMSGYSRDAIATHGELDPGSAFLEKPFSTQALAQKVRQALDSGPSIYTESRNDS
jgi:CheY-like chemotaxis protein